MHPIPLVAPGRTGLALLAAIAIATCPASADPNGAWSRPLPPSVRGYVAVCDPVHRRMIAYGGTDPGSTRSEVWEMALDGPPDWRDITPVGTGPGPRSSASAVYDLTGHRMIVYGGGTSTGQLLGDVWALSLGDTVAWSQLSPAGGPGARSATSAAYDSVGARMLVYGGWNGSAYQKDVWALSLADTPAWSKLATSGTPPSLVGGAVAYDPVRNRLLVARQYLWALTLGPAPAWSQVSGYSGNDDGALAYDPVGDRAVLYGSMSSPDTVVYTLALGTPGALWQVNRLPGPAVRTYHMLVLDAPHRRFVTFGGWGDYTWRHDAWALSLAPSMSWTRLSPAGWSPGSAYGHVSIYDPVRDRVVEYAGAAGGEVDAWEGDSTWVRLLPPSGPPVRLGASAIYDPVRRRLIVFGGSASTSGPFFNDVWAFALDGSPQWAPVTTFGSAPVPRAGAAVIYDPVRDRLVLCGGHDAFDTFQDAWALDLGSVSPTWSRLGVAQHLPVGLAGHSAVYDWADHMIVFGGDIGGAYVNDCYLLDFASDTWRTLPTTGTPLAPRAYHTGIEDPAGHRMIVFGGEGSSGSVPPDFGRDAWALDFATFTWTRLQPAGSPPAARYAHTAVYDFVRDRMVVRGGYGSEPDLWFLDWGDPPTSVAPAAPAAGLVLFVDGPSPHPRDRGLALRYVLDRRADVRVDVCDVAGRRCATPDHGERDAGMHRATWNTRNVAPGVYFVRVAAGPRNRVQRVVVTR